jgi:hypothetical protein
MKQCIAKTVLPVMFAPVLLFAAAGSGHGQWRDLFNGEDLDGWEIRGGFAEFKVEDGTIVGTSVEGSPNTFLCTEKDYGDFILEFEVKVDRGLNSGVQVRSHAVDGYYGGRVYGYQVEIAPVPGASSGGVYDEHRRGWLDKPKAGGAAQEAFKADRWNRYRIEASGGSVRTWVNDVPVADAADCMDLDGFIGLQVHSAKEVKSVRWRNIRVKDLGRHVWKPIFNGRDLDGWHTLPGGRWRVSDGAVVGTSEKTEKRHGLLVTDDVFGDFTVRLKFKTLKGNSGFYFRCEQVAENVGVHGFQAEVEPPPDTLCGGLYETGGRGWVVKPDPEVIKRHFRPGRWNEMTVSARGRRIVVHLNNFKTADLKDDPGRLEGRLALQLHAGNEMLVMFKDIEVLVPEGGC